MTLRANLVTLIAAASLSLCGTAGAQQALSGEFGTSGMNRYSPQVPVSGFASPASWFDPSRLHLSTSVSVGTGYGGRTEGLQVTSLSYQLAAPLAMRVSVIRFASAIATSVRDTLLCSRSVVMT